MNIKKPITILICTGFYCISALFSACSGKPEPQFTENSDELTLSDSVKTADILGAVNAIYSSLKSYQVNAVDSGQLDEYYNIDIGDIDEFIAMRSDPREGLCDIMIAKPADADARERVRACLYGYQTKRMKEFEDYNILSSYEIAQDAVVYDQGEYVVMLMLKDNEAAKLIIDEYIPQ